MQARQRQQKARRTAWLRFRSATKHAVVVAIPVERCEKPDQRMKMLKMIRRIFWVVMFLVLVHPAFAKDERSIRDLIKAMAGLASDVDPKEAEIVSITAHTTARKLARDYHVVLNPEFKAFLVNVGARKRGWCGHWAQDIGTQLKELKLRTLVVHWGVAYNHTSNEKNYLE